MKTGDSKVNDSPAGSNIFCEVQLGMAPTVWRELSTLTSITQTKISLLMPAEGKTYITQMTQNTISLPVFHYSVRVFDWCVEDHGFKLYPRLLTAE